MPTPTLEGFVKKATAIADYRNLAPENPIPVQLPLGNGDSLIVVVSYMEPNNTTLPFNVSWIVVDETNEDFGKVLRRSSALPTARYRNTWNEVTDFESLIAEPQFWDFSSGFNLGEVDVPNTGAATIDVRGLFMLNREFTDDESSPVVVGGNDSRMRNARLPLPHTHPKLPITMIRGASGVNQYTVKIGTARRPVAGEILTITGEGAVAGEWIGEWRRPVAADLVYDGPTFDSITIHAPASNELNETVPFTFTADAEFSDGSTVEGAPVTWSIIGNSGLATIGAVSGNFQSLDIDQDETIRVQARWTHPESGVIRTAYVDIVVRDTTVQLGLVSIAIIGPDTVNENNLALYSVRATFDDGTSAGITPSTFTSSNPGAGLFNAETGELSVGELSVNQQTTISASYTYNGVTRDAMIDVDCIDQTVYPESAVIVGPSAVDENTVHDYVMRVTYTNGTQADVTVNDWASSDEQAGTINSSGSFAAALDLNTDRQTTLSASYTLEGRTVNASRTVTVRDTTVYPRSATILGSSSIQEGTVSQYQLRVTFTDDTTAIVSVNNWALDNEALGVISSTTGQLVAADDLTEDLAGTISASYTAFGTTVSATFNVTVTDETNYPQSARIVGAAQMDENTTQTLLFEVTYLDGTKVNEPITNWASDNVAVASIGPASGVVSAAVNLEANAEAEITGSFTRYGTTVTASLGITVRDTTNYPVSAVINGPNNINEGTTADYTLAVTFSDGTTANRAANWSVAGSSGATINSSGRVTAPTQVSANVGAQINASFTLDGRTVNAPTKNIQIIDTTVYPQSARIVGPNAVVESTSQSYQLEVTFSDASKSMVTVTNWASSNTDAGTINANSGLFSAKPTTGSSTTQISASYSSQGVTVGDAMEVTVTDATNYPVSAVIEGPTTVEENGTATYRLRVTYTDNSTAIVGVTDWASTQTSVGVINPSTGAFQAAANLQADATTRISASYTSDGSTVSAELDVTVEDVTVYPVSAVITGPAIVDSETTAQYELLVTFEDNSTATLDADSWVSSNTSTAGTINSEGLFTAVENVSGANINTTLTAEYTLDGRTVTANRTIAVKDTTNYPASVSVTGPNSVNSSTGDGAGTAQYSATVTYLDGSTAVVTNSGTWTVEGTNQSDNVGTVSNSGLFTANQTPGGSTRNITLRFQYTEFGRTVNGSKVSSLVVVPVPTSLAIVGPGTVASETTTQYTARVTLSNGTQNDVLATFSSTVQGSVAALSSDGLLETEYLASNQTIPVHAEYTANGITVTADRNISATKGKALESVTVSGPTELDNGTSGQYTVTAVYDDATTADVTQSAVYSSSAPAAGSFSATVKGLFEGANVSSNTSTVLTFAYTSRGVTEQATVNLTVNAPAATGNSLPRYGVAMFSDTDLTGGKSGVDPNYGMTYERWDNAQDFCDSVLTNIMPSDNDDESFTWNIGTAQYGYFMHLKSLSNGATFVDQAINVPGGMGGITWTPEGEIGEQFIPLEIMYDSGDGNGPQPWLIYRTDWDSLGTMTFKVSYP